MTVGSSAINGGAGAGAGATEDGDHDEERESLLKKVSNDALFGCIERMQLDAGTGPTGGPGPGTFGRLLDAGTGSHSLRWIASLLLRSDDLTRERGQAEGSEGSPSGYSPPPPLIEGYAAVTADESMRRTVSAEATRLGIEDRGDVLIGNWATSTPANSLPPSSSEKNPDIDVETRSKILCDGETYDTILADYLVGAMDGFSPYYQDMIFDRLRRHLRPGGRLYVVGLEPVPDRVVVGGGGDDPMADVVCRVTKLRDACILLAGHRCYREYPLEWIVRHVEKSGLNVVRTSKFPILYSHSAIVRQLNVARSKLPLFPSKGLADEMSKAIDALEEESLAATRKAPNQRLKLGFDYVVAAELPPDDDVAV